MTESRFREIEHLWIRDKVSNVKYLNACIDNDRSRRVKPSRIASSTTRTAMTSISETS